MNMQLRAPAILLFAFVSAAQAAEDFPARIIRFVVPYPAGGGNDDTARLLGPRLSQSMGQQIVIENRAGASGTIAGAFVAKSKPDGYTIMVDNTAIVVNPALIPGIPYDVRRDLAPVMMTVSFSNMFLVHPSIPARNIKELIALAKANPGKLNYASPGNGSPQHIAMEVFKRAAGADIVHVPYKGGAPATFALLGGEVSILFSGTSGIPHVKAGKARILATTGATRAAVWPDVPTVSESGVKGYTDEYWQGIFVPAKTPAVIVTRLNAEFAKALAIPEVRQQLTERNYAVVSSTPEAFGKAIEDGVARFGKIVRDLNIKAG